MNKLLFVLGSEMFLNNKKVTDIKNKELYIVFFDSVKFSYENALDVMSRNTVLFLKPISQVNVQNGNYSLDLYNIHVQDHHTYIISLTDNLPPLYQNLEIKYPMFTTDLKRKIIINHLSKHSILISLLCFAVWLFIYFSFYVHDVDVGERSALITNLKL